MTAFTPFDVVVLPFPYSDRLADKRRPALIVSSPRLEIQHGLVWAAMITSADNPPWSSDVMVSDLAAAGLPAPSVVRAARVACIDPSRVLRRAGTLASIDREEVASAIRAFLAD